MLVYVVTAHKWGSLEGHSYTCGAFDNRESAIEAANKEMIWKDGKYDFLLSVVGLNDAIVCGKTTIDSEWIKCSGDYDIKKSTHDEYIRSLSHTF